MLNILGICVLISIHMSNIQIWGWLKKSLVPVVPNKHEWTSYSWYSLSKNAIELSDKKQSIAVQMDPAGAGDGEPYDERRVERPWPTG